MHFVKQAIVCSNGKVDVWKIRDINLRRGWWRFIQTTAKGLNSDYFVIIEGVCWKLNTTTIGYRQAINHVIRKSIFNKKPIPKNITKNNTIDMINCTNETSFIVCIPPIISHNFTWLGGRFQLYIHNKEKKFRIVKTSPYC